VILWPLVVDAKFESIGLAEPRTAEAVVAGGKPGTASLLPVD
jgi:hypothetical protein